MELSSKNRDELFEIYVKRYGYMLDFVARSFNVKTYSEEDIKQVFLMTLYDCMLNYDKERGASFKTYLYRSLIRAVHHLLRDQKDMDILSDDTLCEWESPDRLLDDNIERRMQLDSIYRNLDLLEPRYAKIIIDHLCLDKSSSKIGNELGISKQRVRAIFYREFNKLRELI